jgi:hypothetical protein
MYYPAEANYDLWGVEILYRMTLAINLTEVVKVLAGDVGFFFSRRL